MLKYRTMLKKKTKRYVVVYDEVIKWTEGSPVREWEVLETSYRIYDTKNKPFFDIDKRLYLQKGKMFQCLGLIKESFEEFE